MKKISDPQYLRVALALEPRMMFDAAAVTTAAEVVATQAATDAPTVTATPAVDNVYTIDEHGVAGADAPLFSAVTVAADAAGDEVTKLVVTVSTSGADQALVVDGSTIALTATGNSETENHFYTYNVAVSDGKATLTLYLNSGDTVTTDAVASLIGDMRYRALDANVSSGDVTVTLVSITDVGEDTAALGISATVSVDNDVNLAPVLSSDGEPTAAQIITDADLSSASEVAYSADGSHAYVASREGTLWVYSVGDNGALSEIQQLSGISDLGGVTDLAVGDNALYAINGGNLVIFSLADDGSLSGSATRGIGDTGISVSLSDDGSLLFVGSQYNGIYVYTVDGDSGALNDLTRLTDNVSRSAVAAMSGDYLFAIAPGMTQTLAVYSRSGTTLTLVTELSIDEWNWTTSYAHLAISSDASVVYVANQTTGSLSAYRFSGASLTAIDSESLSGLSDIALSDDGTLLYATTTSGTMQIYSVNADGSLTASAAVTGAGGSALTVRDGALLTVGSGTLVSYRYALPYTLEGTPVSALDGLTLSDGNNDALAGGSGNYNGASLLVSASVAGGVFGFANGNGLSYADGIIALNGGEIARFAVGAEGGLTLTFTADVTTAVANQALHQITYANDVAAAGSLIQLSVTGNDGALNSDTQVVTIRINTSPLINPDAASDAVPDVATSETDYQFTFSPDLFTDADGDVLTWSVSGLPPGITFDANTRTLSGAATETGTYAITVTVTDTVGGSASVTLDLVVEQVDNRAPTVNDGAAFVLTPATENTSYSVTLDSGLFSDPDARYGDTLTWSVSGLPEGIVFDAATLTLSGASALVGSYTVIVTATDSSGLSASTTATLRVVSQAEAENRAPTLSADASALVYASDGALSGYGYYVNSITMSDDGATLMIAGSTSNNGNGTSYLSVYQRDTTTGALTLLQTFTQGTSDDGDDSNGIEVDGLSGITSMAFSADGARLYLAGYGADGSSSAYTLSVFDVDADSGALNLAGQFDGPNEKVLTLAVTEEGGALYALSATTIYAYAAGGDGTLSVIGSYSDSYSTAVGMQIGSDGTVYVLSGARLTLYTAAGDGSLTFVGQLTRGGSTLTYTDSAGTASNVAVLSNANAFTGASSLAVSDDGHVYLVTTNGFLTTLQYSRENNMLTLVSTLDAYSALGQFPHGITLSADGSALYVVGGASANLAVYAVDGDGAPSLANVVAMSGGATRIVVSPDGRSIYAGPNLYFAPGLRMIGATGDTAVAYQEGGTIQPASQLTLADADYDALAAGEGNYKGASLTLVRDGGADAVDTYGFIEGHGLTLVDGTLYLDAVAIGTFVSADGTLIITFTADVTTAVANQVLQQIAYTNTSSDPGSSMTLTLTVSDEYTASAVSLKMTIDEINDAPVANEDDFSLAPVAAGSDYSVTLPTSLFSDADDDTLIWSLSGLPDGLSFDSDSRTLSGRASTAGSYVLTLTVTDAAGATASREVTLTVTGESGEPGGSELPLPDVELADVISSELTLDAVLSGVGARASALSPDDTQLYVLGDGVLQVYQRDTATGGLTLIDSLTLTDSALEGATSIAVSADGGLVYVAGDGGGSLVVYGRDPDSGALAQWATFDSTDSGDVTGITELAASADGLSVYAATSAGKVLAFQRNAADNSVTLVGSYDTNTNGWDGAYSVAVSADGTAVYVTVGNGWRVFAFTRSADTGALSHVRESSNTAGNNVMDAAISPDGGFLYTVNFNQNGSNIVIYSVGADGALNEVGTVSVGSNLTDIAVSADGDAVYVLSGAGTDTLVVYRRDSTTGLLTESGRFSHEALNSMLGGVANITVSADGRSVYVTNADSGAVVVFSAQDSDGGDDDSGGGEAPGTPIVVDLKETTGSYTPGEAPIQLVIDSAITQDGVTLLDSYGGATLTVVRAGGASSEDVFSFLDDAYYQYDSATGVIDSGGNAVAVVTVSEGQWVITFGEGASWPQVGSVLHRIGYVNTGSGAESVTVSVAYTAQDGRQASATVIVAVSAVTPINTAPVVVETDFVPDSATDGTFYRVTLPETLFTDADGDPLSWSLSGLPQGMAFDAATRTISGTPLGAGEVTLTVRVEDGAGGQAERTLTLIVNPQASQPETPPIPEPEPELPIPQPETPQPEVPTPETPPPAALPTPETDVNPVILPGRPLFDAPPASSAGTPPNAFSGSRPSPGATTTALFSETRATALGNGPLNYASVPWRLEPVVASLMPELETVDFSALDGQDVPASAQGDVTAWEGRWQPDNRGGWQFTLPDSQGGTQAAREVIGVRLANGRPLPAWLQFDARHGVVRITDAAPQVGQIQLMLETRDGSPSQLLTIRDGQPGIEVEKTAVATPPPPAAHSAERVSAQRGASDVAAPDRARVAFSQTLTAEDDARAALLQAVTSLAADEQARSANHNS